MVSLVNTTQGMDTHITYELHRLASCHYSSPPRAPMMHKHQLNLEVLTSILYCNLSKSKGTYLIIGLFSEPSFVSIMYFIMAICNILRERQLRGRNWVSFIFAISLAFNTISEHTSFFILLLYVLFFKHIKCIWAFPYIQTLTYICITVHIHEISHRLA